MCSPPPQFYANESHKLPFGAEVSYGTPYRISGAKMLAAELKAALCGAHQNTAECTKILNTSHWTIPTFLRSFFDDPVSLVHEQNYKKRPAAEQLALPPPIRNASTASHASMMWKDHVGWVFCANTAGDTNCKGTIDWNDWKKDPVGSCMNTFKESALQDESTTHTMHIPICDMTDTMNELCISLKQAELMVMRANCIAGGDCLTYTYVYSPGMYSYNNKEFARSSVTNYYNLHGETCQLDATLEALKRQNDNILNTCTANQLQFIIETLQYMRDIVHKLIKAVFYTIRIVLTLFRLLMTQTAEEVQKILTSIRWYFSELWALIKELLLEVANQVWKLVFTEEGAIGHVFHKMVQSICEKINIAITWFYGVYCLLINQVAIPVMDFFIWLIEKVDKIPFVKIGNFVDDVRAKKTQLEQQPACNDKIKYIECGDDDIPDDDEASGTTPLPTRCWADYIPFVGDSDVLSCTSSDTCVTESTSEDLVVCAACPTPRFASMNRFGCDTLTKRCTCNRVQSSYSSCVSNEQCFLDGLQSTCRLVSEMSYTITSYGSTPCSECSLEPICLLPTGSKLGQCVCPLTLVKPQTCTDVAEAAQFSYNGMCVADLMTNTQFKGVTVLSWNSVAVVPCQFVAAGQSYCFEFRDRGRLIVGLQLIDVSPSSPRRALFAYPLAEIQTTAEHLLFSGDWNATAQPCKVSQRIVGRISFIKLTVASDGVCS